MWDRHRADSARDRPKLARLRPTWNNIGPEPTTPGAPGIDHPWPEFGRTLSEIDQWPELGRNRQQAVEPGERGRGRHRSNVAEFGCATHWGNFGTPTFDRLRPDLNNLSQTQPNLSRNRLVSTQIGPGSTGVGPNSARCGPNSTKFVPASSKFAQTRLEVGAALHRGLLVVGNFALDGGRSNRSDSAVPHRVLAQMRVVHPRLVASPIRWPDSMAAATKAEKTDVRFAFRRAALFLKALPAGPLPPPPAAEFQTAAAQASAIAKTVTGETIQSAFGAGITTADGVRDRTLQAYPNRPTTFPVCPAWELKSP